MSSASVASPPFPIEHRDIRSASLPFKRDKDHGEKWSHGMRPSAGVRTNIMNPTEGLIGGSESQKMKVRPMSQMPSDYKSHANKTPKPTAHTRNGHDGISSRIVRKLDAIVDANDHTSTPLSRSLLELLPQHANNTETSIHTAVREANIGGDAGVFYSYDHAGVSPGVRGNEVDLGGLVDLAEKKWLSEQTDRIVKGEYEVLDGEGETTVLTSGKGKKKGSPKQKAIKTEPSFIKDANDEDDGFELV